MVPFKTVLYLGSFVAYQNRNVVLKVLMVIGTYEISRLKTQGTTD